MRRALNAIIRLYPKPWRNRYHNEFDALLDDVQPTWRTLFDVLGGALKMQLKIWSPWKSIAAFAALGLLCAIAYSFTLPDRYVSTGLITIEQGGPEGVSPIIPRMASRTALAKLINEQGLYESERRKEPFGDVIEQMKKDIRVTTVKSTKGLPAISISFAATDAAKARRTVQGLIGQFLDASLHAHDDNRATGHTFAIYDPPSLPVRVGPRRSRIIIMGVIAGLVAGVLFALFNGLRVWKLATALGFAGAVLFAVASYLVPDRYSSSAVLQYRGTEAQMHNAIHTVVSGPDLQQLVAMFRMFPGDPQGVRKLSEHLHLEPLPANAVVLISSDDTNRFQAQKVTRRVAYYLMDEAEKAPSPMTVEMIDPPTLSLNPYFPNRLNVAVGGLALGLLVATMLGIRGRRLESQQSKSTKGLAIS